MRYRTAFESWPAMSGGSLARRLKHTCFSDNAVSRLDMSANDANAQYEEPPGEIFVLRAVYVDIHFVRVHASQINYMRTLCTRSAVHTHPGYEGLDTHTHTMRLQARALSDAKVVILRKGDRVNHPTLRHLTHPSFYKAQQKHKRSNVTLTSRKHGRTLHQI